MTSLLFEKNKQAYQFLESTQERLNRLIEPLSFLKITYFAYAKFYMDGRYLTFINNLPYQKSYYENIENTGYLISNTIKGCLESSQRKIISFQGDIKRYSQNQDPIAYQLYNHGIWNLVSIYRAAPDGSVESFHFAGKKEDIFIVDFCLNNMDILNKFINYFQLKGKDLMDTSDPARLGYYSNSLAWSEDKKEKERNLESFERYVSKYGYSIRDIYGIFQMISPREAQCLNELLKANRVKEVAKNMRISPRTVEFYLNKVKEKTGYSTTSKLLQQFVRDNINI